MSPHPMDLLGSFIPTVVEQTHRGERGWDVFSRLLDRDQTRYRARQFHFRQCTRHTFASQWVMNGGSMEMFAQIMGHSFTSTTQHYAHSAPDFFGAKAFDMVAVDLTRPTGNVVNLPRSVGPLRQRMGRDREFSEEESQPKSA